MIPCGEALNSVLDDNRYAVGVVLLGEQDPAFARHQGMAHDIRAELAHDELDVVNVAACTAEIFQQDMPNAPDDSQTSPVAGQA